MFVTLKLVFNANRKKNSPLKISQLQSYFLITDQFVKTDQLLKNKKRNKKKYQATNY